MVVLWLKIRRNLDFEFGNTQNYPNKQNTGKQRYSEGKGYDKIKILVRCLNLFTQRKVFNKLHCKIKNELASSENRH